MLNFAKFMPRTITRYIAKLLKKCMKFCPDHTHDLALWAGLDLWLEREQEAIDAKRSGLA